MSANAKLKKEEESRHTASVKRKRMSRPRKRLDCVEGRDFFRMAASFANAEKRESDFGEQIRRAPKEVVASLASSPFLQTSYQERSPLFVVKHKTAPLQTFSSFGYSVLEKWQRACGAREPAIDEIFLDADDDVHDIALTALTKNGLIKNGVQFSPQESAYLVFVAEKFVVKEFLARPSVVKAPKLSAPVFHRALKKCIDQIRPRSFLCIAQNGNLEKKLVVERARLFWSHRLQTKALQTFSSAESSICYFHAALRSKTTPLSFDFLYWLRLDEEKVVQDGDFIDLESTNLRAVELFFPERLLLDGEVLKTHLAAKESQARLFVLEVNRLLTH